MGCTTSKPSESLQHCKERRTLMKQLVAYRADFAAALSDYLRALRNIGATLCQLADVDLLELEDIHLGLDLTSSPQSPLQFCPPPPPPPFSPDTRNSKFSSFSSQPIVASEERFETYNFDGNLLSEPLQDSVNPVGPSLQNQSREGASRNGHDDQEDWVDTDTKYEGENTILDKDLLLHRFRDNHLTGNLGPDPDPSSTPKLPTTADGIVLGGKNKTTLPRLIKKLDDYFLIASAGVKEMSILMDFDGVNLLYHGMQELKRKKGTSAKIFNSLSRGWSFKSTPSSVLHEDLLKNDGACRPGAHSATLSKIFSEEQKLYTKMVEQRAGQLQYEKKITELKKHENEAGNLARTETLHSSINSLQSELCCLQDCISKSYSSILLLRDHELHPQVLQLSSGLMNLWKTMSDCHQAQNDIAQSMNNFFFHNDACATPGYHNHATAQLEAEIISWHTSFCSLLQAQHDYVHTLARWMVLSDFPTEGHPSEPGDVLLAVCEEWRTALNRLPAKLVVEAIKGLASVVHAMYMNQVEEGKLKRRSDLLHRKLKKHTDMLQRMEKKSSEVPVSSLSSTGLTHQLSTSRAKVEILRTKAEMELAKYSDIIQLNHARAFNSFRTCLIDVFQALNGFARVAAEIFEAVCNVATPTNCKFVALQSSPL